MGNERAIGPKKKKKMRWKALGYRDALCGPVDLLLAAFRCRCNNARIIDCPYAKEPPIMAADDSFGLLMGGLQGGDAEAAGALFHRFAQRLIALARQRLEPRLRSKVDPEDILQSVFKSFFRRRD